jgi:hypothetical protein
MAVRRGFRDPSAGPQRSLLHADAKGETAPIRLSIPSNIACGYSIFLDGSCRHVFTPPSRCGRSKLGEGGKDKRTAGMMRSIGCSVQGAANVLDVFVGVRRSAGHAQGYSSSLCSLT